MSATPVELHNAAMKLFREQALTLSKSGERVMLQCDSPEDADTLFEYLALLDGNSVAFEGRASGDMECFVWDDVPKAQRLAINDDEDEFEKLDRLYPNDVVRAIEAATVPSVFQVSTLPLATVVDSSNENPAQ